MYTPKVSIGMPVYNGEKTIRESLDSLLNQTFTNYEIIISDNSSTDSTGGICQEYLAKDSRIKYIRQSKNRGAVENFQFVLDEARGEYFMWAAADDLWSPDWISTLVRHAHPYRVCFGSLQRIGMQGQLLGDVQYKNIRFPKSRLGRLIGLILPYPVSYNYLIYGLYPVASLKKIQAGRAFGYLPTPIAPNGNEIIVLFLVLQDHSIIIDESVTFYYRMGGVSTVPKQNLKRKLRNFLTSPIYALIGTMRLLTLLPRYNGFTCLLSLAYLTAGIYRLMFSYLRTALYGFLKCKRIFSHFVIRSIAHVIGSHSND